MKLVDWKYYETNAHRLRYYMRVGKFISKIYIDMDFHPSFIRIIQPKKEYKGWVVITYTPEDKLYYKAFYTLFDAQKYSSCIRAKEFGGIV